jgi:hypothetical protein
MYLTAAHQSPPSHITLNGKRWPVATLIARDDQAMLATLGVYPHETAPGEAPLGYTDWALADGEYRREPAGTPEERQAAIDAAVAAAREAELAAQWAQQAADRATREANEALAEPTTSENLSQQLAAIRLLSGV